MIILGAQDAHAIGTLAARILFRRIDGDTTPVQAHIVPARLIPEDPAKFPT
jgi:LacI family transcriptional regulator